MENENEANHKLLHTLFLITMKKNFDQLES